MVIKAVLTFLIGYLLGSVNTSLIVGKFYKVDVRQHGSGNAGMTNTLRTLGKLPAIFVIIGDVLKGVLACIIGNIILTDAVEIHDSFGAMVGGIGAILGHNWPVYFGFKGGKGVLTAFAVIMTTKPLIGLILLAFFILIVLITRYVSLGSIVAAMLFPAVSFFMEKEFIYIIFAGLIGLLVITRHKSNIERLINGKESKLGAKKT
ncbi:MAG TPA: acyl-phosphate glycerol 3-phosphate acyltransferase [Ruminiclostridium sp.]|jgi:glycerol-3-phosphate acyltransferase PlsY|uniref:Glycerol-3-phosphate acyltransferase n=1 Tax=Acetivibrio saccincola TaxID=1677857 RepID=A0A2K9E2S4_9FIRM|nr:glycerol-3-phosphate 1-O-acyltransferase PlsY [Acetivibrio saccincola]HAA42862.1 acyl-phosphate glycerol 3-phosphate acyltransferase [Ruminiclostridium sp.]AUG58057.1 Glycerol-3-phosphate acyltransferase [Acetivibrio saccincola]NLW27909.1 glycerol-3-phosphate 1-O-acyltransferase PlsY [Acetivibrio saccincola]PQQ67945.1 acyl-phosphate glycerol 3-phosphate acyltransferase [Acetivibrio saccincola]HOA98154.1 glycerol-3-phosphate 1-O-acyltransferase PlsY [Acetivibrio saccincola]